MSPPYVECFLDANHRGLGPWRPRNNGKKRKTTADTAETGHNMPGKDDGLAKPPNSGGLKRKNNELQEVARRNRGISRFREKDGADRVRK
jgi:hypothetical protein